MMKRKKMFSSSKKASNAVCLLAGALLSLSAAYGQRPIDSEKGNRESLSLKDRMYYGGGLNVGVGITEIGPLVGKLGVGVGVNAIAGYTVNPGLSAGIGLLWLNIGYYYGPPFAPIRKAHTNQYGGHLFARYYFTKRFFFYGEVGLLSAEVSVAEGKRGALVRAPMGAGFRILRRRKSRGLFTLEFMYDMFNDPREGSNVYGVPLIVRISLTNR